MVTKAQIRTCEIRGHKKKKNISPTPSTSMSHVRTCGGQFRKIKIFVFMVLKAKFRTCELRGHEKKNFHPPQHRSHGFGPMASMLEIVFLFFMTVKLTGDDLFL